MCLYDSNEKKLCNIPIKNKIKYLGINITKDLTEKQELNFSPKLKKAQSIFNNWLQRDLTIIGRVLLTKVEGYLDLFIQHYLFLFKILLVKKFMICLYNLFGGINIII